MNTEVRRAATKLYPDWRTKVGQKKNALNCPTFTGFKLEKDSFLVLQQPHQK